MRIYSAICSVVWLATGGTAALAQSGDGTVAYVFSKSGESPSTIWVERGGDGPRQPLSTGTKLKAGDEVHAIGRNGRVVLRVARQGEVRVSMVSGPYTVPAAKNDDALTGAIGAFVRKVSWAFGLSDGHQEKRTSVGRRSEEAEPLSPHPLLANKPQTMIFGVRPVVIWCGLGTSIAPEIGDAEPVQAADFGIVSMPVPASAPKSFVISGPDNDSENAAKVSHRIEVEWTSVDQLPRPDWLATPASGVGETTGWGLWLATEAPKQYRLAGLSMLYKVREQSIEASYALDSLITCPSS